MSTQKNAQSAGRAKEGNGPLGKTTSSGLLENEGATSLLDLIKSRRSIRKYTNQQIPTPELELIIESGLWAANAGGGQRSYLVGIQDPNLIEKLGRLNVDCMNRDALIGKHVSADQPSIIDKPAIKSGFYGAPSLVAIFSLYNFGYGEADAYCCAQNMTLAAHDRGISSCIVARGEQTFDNIFGRDLMKQWSVPDHYAARCFVCLGYNQGPYPKQKPRKPNRFYIA